MIKVFVPTYSRQAGACPTPALQWYGAALPLSTSPLRNNPFNRVAEIDVEALAAGDNEAAGVEA
ncbi:hypothetical protein Mal52_29120 [Symmachiella dynata]|uniref:Uncharacterized protein n=1 Tax=Symmachiella dynata TaxID=2527995 RepID=A0A517ZPP8_9PLAN|nr:hypothetical protein Mal52_29120 [Symmachiella dynata]